MTGTSSSTSSSTLLSYANTQGDNSFLDPKAYEGKVRLPQSAIQAAKANGQSYVVSLVALDANNAGGNQPVARGFYVLQDLKTNEQTLIPFVSGGGKIATSNMADARTVEECKNAPLPGLVADDTSKGDGIHRQGKIELFSLNEGDDFRFFMGLSSGTASRAGIGAHRNRNHESKGGKGVSYGCPVVPPAYEEKMIGFLKSHGVKTGDTYTILDPSETIAGAPKITGLSAAAPDSAPTQTSHLQDAAAKAGETPSLTNLYDERTKDVAPDNMQFIQLIVVAILAMFNMKDKAPTAAEYANNPNAGREVLQRIDEQGLVKQTPSEKPLSLGGSPSDAKVVETPSATPRISLAPTNEQGDMRPKSTEQAISLSGLMADATTVEKPMPTPAIPLNSPSRAPQIH